MTIRRNVGQVTKGAVAVGQRSAGRIIGKTCEHVPTGAVLVVQTESRSEIVDAGFALVGAIAIFTQPGETLANHQLCQRATILALCRFVHLLAKSLEHRIAYRMRWRDRDNLVRARLGGRWRLLTARLVSPYAKDANSKVAKTETRK